MTDPEIAMTLAQFASANAYFADQLKRATDLIGELSKMQLQNLELIVELLQRIEALERRVNQ
jgi:hypothetical protein